MKPVILFTFVIAISACTPEEVAHEKTTDRRISTTEIASLHQLIAALRENPLTTGTVKNQLKTKYLTLRSATKS